MVRPLAPGDVGALAGVHHRALHRAYGTWVDPERLGSLEERQESWAQPPVPGHRTLVYDLAGQLAGFTTTCVPARDRDVAAAVGELVALYVDPPAQGAGVGGALLAAAVAQLREAGCREAVLWVVEANEHARHVYETRGWAVDRAGREDHPWGAGVRYRLGL